MFHDSYILAYSVDIQNKILEVTLLDSDTDQKIIVQFVNVLTHHFHNTLTTNIIYGLYEGSIDDLIRQNELLLKKQKEYGWPMSYRDFDELNDYLTHGHYHYYYFDAIVGLNGIVIAKKMTIINQD